MIVNLSAWKDEEAMKEAMKEVMKEARRCLTFSYDQSSALKYRRKY